MILNMDISKDKLINLLSNYIILVLIGKILISKISLGANSSFNSLLIINWMSFCSNPWKNNLKKVNI